MSVLLQLLQMSPTIAIFALMLWFAMTKMRAYDDHVKECGEIPKKFIMDKIESVQSDVCDLKDTVDTMSQRQVVIGDSLQVLVGRQTEKDRSHWRDDR